MIICTSGANTNWPKEPPALMKPAANGAFGGRRWAVAPIRIEKLPAPAPAADSTPRVSISPNCELTKGVAAMPAASITPPSTITRPAPYLSATAPKTGCEAPHMNWPTAIAKLSVDEQCVVEAGLLRQLSLPEQAEGADVLHLRQIALISTRLHADRLRLRLPRRADADHHVDRLRGAGTLAIELRREDVDAHRTGGDGAVAGMPQSQLQPGQDLCSIQLMTEQQTRRLLQPLQMQSQAAHTAIADLHRREMTIILQRSR
jgi:hypothetical protein